jgi:hypothetical protein
VEFFAEHGHLVRGVDGDAYLAAADLRDRDLDAAVDDDGFVELAGENEHGSLLRER